jgi:hypothetical protein
MDSDMVRRVEPNIGCAELGLQVSEPLGVPGRKVHGPKRHEMQRERAAGKEKRQGGVPGEAQHRSL